MSTLNVCCILQIQFPTPTLFAQDKTRRHCLESDIPIFEKAFLNDIVIIEASQRYSGSPKSPLILQCVPPNRNIDNYLKICEQCSESDIYSLLMH